MQIGVHVLAAYQQQIVHNRSAQRGSQHLVGIVVGVPSRVRCSGCRWTSSMEASKHIISEVL